MASCINKGGKLFEPKNEKVNIEVTNLAKDRGLDSFWLGINDKSQENNFVYASDGSPITYENWCPHHDCYPCLDEPSGNGDCVWIGHAHSCSDHSMWDDRTCSDVIPFVCEKGKLDQDLPFKIMNDHYILYLHFATTSLDYLVLSRKQHNKTQ